MCNVTFDWTVFDQSQAEEFCEQLGLITDGKHVKLTKGGVVFPEDVMVTRHCLQLIDSKTDKSFGEVSSQK